MAIEIEKFLGKNNWDEEKSALEKRWWYIKNLAGLPAVDCEIDLMSLDISVMPWELTTIGDFIGHTLDIQKCDDRFPIIVTPQGWIMNGWHRVVKAILAGKIKIKAVRLIELPEPDGVNE